MKKHFQYLVFIAFLLNATNCFAQVAPHIQWQKSFGGSDGDVMDYGLRYTQTNDGGFILAGSSTSNDIDVSGNHGSFDYWVVKLNASRNIIWQKSLGGSGIDIACNIQQTVDSGYIVAGSAQSMDGDVKGHHGVLNNHDFWIVKLNNLGDTIWERSLGGAYNDVAQSIQQTSDGGYIVAGSTESNDGDVTGSHGGRDVWIVKLDGTGNIMWQKALGGSSSESAFSIQQTSDGGYVAAGFSNSNNGNVSGNHGEADIWVVKLNASGVIIWQKSLGGTNIDTGSSIQQTSDGGYIVAGITESNDGNVTGHHGAQDYWVVKLDAFGNISWQKSLGGYFDDRAFCIQQTNDGAYVVVGDTRSVDGDVVGNHGYSDGWIVKLSSIGSMLWERSLGGSDQDKACLIQQTVNGGYIVVGQSASKDWDLTANHGTYDYWIVKLNNGNCNNSVTANGPTTFCSGGSVTLTADSGAYYLWNTGATTQSIVVTTAGTYTAYIDGCQYGYAVNISVNALPSAIITTSGATTFCSGDSVYLNANVGAGLNYQWKKGTTLIAGATLSSYKAKTGGTYRVIVTNSTGCSKTSGSKVVTVNPLPSAAITASGPIAFCAGGSVTFTTSSGTGYIYQWKRNNINISGATNINYTASIAGNYKVVVTHPNGCSRTSTTKTVTIPCRESDESISENSVKVYPVPVFDILYIESNGFTGKGNIYLRNNLGQEIIKHECDFENPSKSIDMSKISHGTYFVILTDNDHRKMIEIFKE